MARARVFPSLILAGTALLPLASLRASVSLSAGVPTGIAETSYYAEHVSWNDISNLLVIGPGDSTAATNSAGLTISNTVNTASDFLTLAPAPAVTPDLTALRGTWTALVQGGSYETTGRFRVVLNRFGRGSGSLRIGDEPNCVIGMWVQPDGSILRVGGDPDMGIDLRVILRGGETFIVGTVSDDGHEVPVELVKAAATAPEDVPGRYTAVFANTTAGGSLPVGVAGGGVVRVGRRGQVSFVGRLADGTVVTQGATLDRDGTWQFYDRLRGGAILSGAIAFADQTEADFTGALTLLSPGEEEDETGETFALSLVGSRYRASLGFGAAGSWTLEANGLAGDTGTISASLMTDAVRGPLRASGSGNDPRAQLILNRASGVVRGSLREAPGGRPHRLTGVVFQKTASGAGIAQRGNADAGTFTFGFVSGAGSAGVTKAGSGTLQTSGSGSVSGGTLTVAGGSLTLGGSGTTAGGTLTLAPGASLVTGGLLGPGASIGTTLTLAPSTVFGVNYELLISSNVNHLGEILNTPSAALPVLTPEPLTLGGTLSSAAVVTSGASYSGATVSGIISASGASAGSTLSVISMSGISSHTGTIQITNAVTLPAWQFETIGDAVTVKLGSAADAPSYTGAELKALLNAARARGDATLALGVTTFDLLAPRPVMDL